jgi:ribosomal protein S18 acetylase RimI-like enzyme
VTASASSFVVRSARLADEEAVLSLWEEMTAAHARLAPRFFSSTEAGRREARRRDARRLRTTLADRQRALLVVEETRARGTRIVGLISVRVYDTPPDPTLVALRRAHVEEVIVTRTARRRGYGRALVDAAAAWAKSQGARQLLLTVWSGNAAAERFYDALRFRTVNRVLATEL